MLKIAGFKAGPKEVNRITKEEMFQFSHQVPSYLLTGEEAHNALKACFELDPSTTHVDLIWKFYKAHDEPLASNIVDLLQNEVSSSF